MKIFVLAHLKDDHVVPVCPGLKKNPTPTAEIYVEQQQ